MLKSPLRTSVLTVMLLVLGSSSVFSQDEQFKLGVVSDKPVGRIKEYGPVAEYAAKRLKKFGMTSGKIVVAKNTGQMEEKIRNKEVDVVFESAFPTMELKEKAGTKPALLVWKKGSREYHAVFFVKKQSPIQKLTDLRGRTVAFEDPQSTSAYLLPKAELKQSGLTVVPLNEKGATDAVRSVFAGEETNQAFWVIQGKADAGVFSSDDWTELSPKVRSELRLVHETKPVLRFIASFHPAMSKELSNAISTVLTEMDTDPEGQTILKEAANIKKIEKLSDSDRRSLKYVQGLLTPS